MKLTTVVFALLCQSSFFQDFPALTSGNWTEAAPTKARRAEASSLVYDNKIYVFHGYNPVWVVSHTSETYDPQTNAWTDLAPLPSGNHSGMTHNGIALVGDEVWLTGGKSGYQNILTNKVLIYNIPKNEWRPGPDLPENIGSASLVKLGKKLHLIAGGTHPAGTQPAHKNFCVLKYSHYVLDLNQPEQGWQDILAPLPPGFGRIHQSTVTIGGKIYLMGGQDGHDCGNSDKSWLHVYDPTPMPGPDWLICPCPPPTPNPVPLP
ncbi:MAG: hypothetical protein HC880_11345 [Bacteroidia bacterium]|nr:hypothetical protein [Bacteroidia bacterium]